ncbi:MULTISPECIES: hypothetical protein [unclassified Ruegeria]|uniref:hypothetical protein n=1 Tax=unclassified Ruegeria TaxID=2625375 RepID=UPI00148A0672|nr:MULTISPECIES: hypothetical protein [unclassified Ruegeria]NOD36065.1 hypothetical protein [Ruegeria sp. HKCCD7296]NOD45791.1 hypothetical protein [Ruegeria sp. HKCCD5849]NOD50909.1 hypothetical protein [Ruegeria sp. HKCCD5851]NOD67716.1 hypothetical protein [Ruegeria sp. HKCCD7303]NOE35635.1 hypothetical protein [Ruegeria sp. HKCCD7318]
MQDDVLATIQASSPRRWAGVGMLTTVGALVTYVALASPPEPMWQVFLFAVGGASLWLAYRVWHATQDCIELTQSELRTGSGQIIARIEDIETVDRGVFAFKPSNGFLVRMRHKMSYKWAPGLWWRLGRRVGVGGMTAAAEAKFMSEALNVIIADKGRLR